VIFGVAYTFFTVQNTVSIARGKGGIRSSESDEIAGLDMGEMGVYAYPEFEAAIDEYEHEHAGNGEVDAPVPVG